MNQKQFSEEIVKFLPQRLRNYFFTLTEKELSQIQEIRFRVGRPLNVLFDDGDLFLGKTGLYSEPTKGEVIGADDVGRSILFFIQSLYLCT